MTKVFLVAPIVAICLWVPQTKALDLKFMGRWSNSSAQEARGLLEYAWNDWSRDLKIRDPHLRIELVKGSEIHGYGGRSTPGRIAIHEKFATEPSLLRHELAHVWWSQRCGPQPGWPQWLHEVLAQWQSGDHRRISSQADGFIYAKDASDWLDKKRWAPVVATSATGQKALARLLTQLEISNDRAQALNAEISNCKFAKEWPARMIALLKAKEERPEAHAIDMLIVHEPTGEILIEEGLVNKVSPHGSILKPLLISQIPKLREPVYSREHGSWNCPLKETPRLWAWEEGLVKSCNGFFLDHVIPKQELNAMNKTISELLGKFPRPLEMSAWMGLTKGMEISPREAFLIYRWLQANAPEVLAPLNRIWDEGTLAKSDVREWFKTRHGWAKTGTVRSIKGDPEWAWLVTRVELPQGPTWAILRAQGLSTLALLEKAHEKLLEADGKALRPVQVQVLGLAPSETLRWKCPEGGLAIVENKVSVAKVWTPLPAQGEWQCLSGPIAVQTPKLDGFLTKNYYGNLQRAPVNEVTSSTEMTSKQARARRGSSVWLTTSERQYIAGVMASEFASGREETMKLLALAARTNIQLDQHDGTPPCDTTHCQVFGSINELSTARRNRLLGLVDEVSGLELAPTGEELRLEYSLGGHDPWTRRVKDAEVTRLEKDVWLLNGAKVNCERLRLALHLPSCPDSAERDGFETVFSGKGEGHGRGLNLVDTESLAASGAPLRTLIDKLGIKFKLKPRLQPAAL